MTVDAKKQEPYRAGKQDLTLRASVILCPGMLNTSFHVIKAQKKFRRYKIFPDDYSQIITGR